ncbi:MAG: hypothetical protein U5L04_01935 [Trueperaceae bacterium]|nr:hypothetical protein [Trueperaceae bacterium]
MPGLLPGLVLTRRGRARAPPTLPDRAPTPHAESVHRARQHVARLAAYLNAGRLPRYLGLAALSAAAELDTLSELLQAHGLQLRWRDRRYKGHALVFAERVPDTNLSHTKGPRE